MDSDSDNRIPERFRKLCECGHPQHQHYHLRGICMHIAGGKCDCPCRRFKAAKPKPREN